jgi:hypothetical protein
MIWVCRYNDFHHISFSESLLNLLVSIKTPSKVITRNKPFIPAFVLPDPLKVAFCLFVAVSVIEGVGRKIAVSPARAVLPESVDWAKAEQEKNRATIISLVFIRHTDKPLVCQNQCAEVQSLIYQIETILSRNGK